MLEYLVGSPRRNAVLSVDNEAFSRAYRAQSCSDAVLSGYWDGRGQPPEIIGTGLAAGLLFSEEGVKRVSAQNLTGIEWRVARLDSDAGKGDQIFEMWFMAVSGRCGLLDLGRSESVPGSGGRMGLYPSLDGYAGEDFALLDGPLDFLFCSDAAREVLEAAGAGRVDVERVEEVELHSMTWKLIRKWNRRN